MYRSVRLDQKRSSYAVVILLVAGFAVIGWLWFVFASGFWDVSSLEIGGLRSLERGDVEREVDHALSEGDWRPWHNRNLIFIDTSKLAAELKERLFAEDVAVDKVYPNVLRLLIKERQRSVVVVSGQQYVNVDSTGVVTGDADGDVLTAAQERIAARAFADEIHLPVIVMPTADPLTAGFSVAAPETVRHWIEVSRAMVLEGVKVRFMKIETPESALARFVSERGYDIYIDLTQPLEPQIQNYVAYMRSKPDLAQIKEHIDVRVPGKIYIK